MIGNGGLSRGRRWRSPLTAEILHQIAGKFEGTNSSGLTTD